MILTYWNFNSLNVSENTQQQVFFALGIMVAECFLLYFSLWIGRQNCVSVTPM